MKARLRAAGTVLGVLAVVFLVLALAGIGGGPAGQGGELTARMLVREKLISGAYKVYGLKDQPVSLWLAKTVFRNDTGGTVKDLKVRYRLGDYADWCAWQSYPQLVPGQTVVDLYQPILSSKCAQLTSRAPAELQMECEYVNSAGEKKSHQKAERLTMLSRREFYFTDLKAQERTGSFQDFATTSPLLAAWVTPTDTPVTGLAGLANERAKGAGAAISDENCIAVLRELYEIMRTIKITYQSPAHQIEPDKSFDITLIQTLQYPRDTIEKRSGTCIDLAILYAAMMNSVGIKPLLVSLDGHCFPMGVTPSGQFVPVEATCVGGGGKDSLEFEKAVKIGLKEWSDLQKSGRFVITDCQQCWGAGISPPELDPLPADILERWKITEAVRAAPQPAPAPTPPAGNTGGAPAQPSALAAGNWAFAVTQQDGSKLQGAAQVAVQANRVQMVFNLAYQVTGYDGQPHQAREQNTFVGAVSGQQLLAQCQQAVWTLDGQAVQPQGLPYTLRLAVAADGRSAQGTVTNAMGSGTQLVMQAQ